MKLVCPACHRPLPAEQINVQTDIALCGACGELSRVSEIADTDLSLDPDDTAPPRGAWHRPGIDQQIYGATTRHAVAFFLLPFTLVWGGGSLGGIFGTALKEGGLHPMLFLFGLPFLVGTIALTGLTALAIAGKVELRLRGSTGEVFTGVGPFGWRRRFNLAEIERVGEEPGKSSHPGGQGWCIVLSGRERLRFGHGLREDRRHFLLRALRAAHRAARR
jgi:hypothetical protein